MASKKLDRYLNDEGEWKSRWEWRLRYTVLDQGRDTPRLIRRKPPALRPEVARHDAVHPPTPGEERQAAEESAYTSSSQGAISDAGEAPPSDFVAKLSPWSRLQRAEQVRHEIEGEAA